MIELLYLIGGSVCHRIGERSILLGGRLLPMCARCTGIYSTFFISSVLLFLFKRWNGNKVPEIAAVIFAAISFLPFMIDGTGSYLGFWETNNLIRIITGVFAGYSLPIFFILLINFKVNEPNDKPLINNIYELYFMLSICVLFAMMVYNGNMFYFVASITSSMAVIFLYTNAIAVLLRLVFNKINIFKIYIAAFVICIAMLYLISYITSMF